MDLNDRHRNQIYQVLLKIMDRESPVALQEFDDLARKDLLVFEELIHRITFLNLCRDCESALNEKDVWLLNKIKYRCLGIMIPSESPVIVQEHDLFYEDETYCPPSKEKRKVLDEEDETYCPRQDIGYARSRKHR